VELCQLGRTVRRGCGPPGPLSPQIGASKDLNAAARRRQQGRSITTKCLLRRLVATGRCHRPGVEFCTKSPLRHCPGPHFVEMGSVEQTCLRFYEMNPDGGTEGTAGRAVVAVIADGG